MPTRESYNDILVNKDEHGRLLIRNNSESLLWSIISSCVFIILGIYEIKKQILRIPPAISYTFTGSFGISAIVQLFRLFMDRQIVIAKDKDYIAKNGKPVMAFEDIKHIQIRKVEDANGLDDFSVLIIGEKRKICVEKGLMEDSAKELAKRLAQYIEIDIVMK